MTKEPDQCELCRRTPVLTTVHHLTPREEGGSLLPTANLCVACHQHIHHLYTNRQLVELQLTTIKALLTDPQQASFLKWIRKQPASTIPYHGNLPMYDSPVNDKIELSSVSCRPVQ